MNWEEFRAWGRRAADWAADYHAGLRNRPVRAQVAPGAVLSALPDAPPDASPDAQREAREHPMVKAAFAAFPDAELLEETQTPSPRRDWRREA